MSQAIGIIQRFPFSSALQRMSVITVAPGGQGAAAFLKGAPEMVASHCLKESGKETHSAPSAHFRGEVMQAVLPIVVEQGSCFT